MAGVSINAIKIFVSPYRICPLGAHIDHQVDTYFYLPNRFIFSYFFRFLFMN
ncbi:putative galacturonokinase [Helianthus annuus]|nr:putative galacturonokinase [Helianthus annuus]KAJ0474087.1 putative galacturonokinase [Helianthus annuus]KAJ0649652.1 putative galacturonokinase [Helianthus annuus]KAJ0653440.1 putative galacturonokinase [Helianthus annuus]